MIDVSALVGDIPTTSITVRTFGAPTINAFGESAAASTDTPTTAVVHPLKRRRDRQPSTDHAREQIAIYVTAADALDTVRATPAPWVEYAGRWYEVTEIEDYAELGGLVIAVAELRDEVAS